MTFVLANDYSDLNEAVFEAQNKARTEPEYFAAYAQYQIDNEFIYDGSGNPTTQLCLDDDFIAQSTTCSSRLNTNEGSSAWEEVATDLDTYTAISELTWSEGLSQA